MSVRTNEEATTLRTILSPIALAALVALAPIGAAENPIHRDDPAGDESALFGFEELARIILSSNLDCHSPAADVRSLDMFAQEGNLTMSLALTSLSSLDGRCGYVGVDGQDARYSVRLDEEVDDPTSLDYPFSLYASARTTGLGLAACIEIQYEDAYSDDCLGSFERHADTLVWTIPLAGEITVLVSDDPLLGIQQHEEIRAYDLTAHELDLGASASVALDGKYSLVSIDDSLEGGLVRLG